MNRTILSLSFCLITCLVWAQPALKDSLAEKMLVYQLPNGAWPKQLTDKKAINYALALTEELKQKIKKTDNNYATIDNSATTREINTLVEAFGKTQNCAYKEAALKGIRYLLEAQYVNGGFPQYYPNNSLYRGEVTYNDNAMINALTVLDNVASAQEGFAIYSDPKLRKAAKDAVARGVDCILKTQIKQADSLTIWAAQYDAHQLTPAQARNFEPVSLSTAESVAIVRFLMKQPYDSVLEVRVDAALAWFQCNGIKGYRYDKVLNAATGKLTRDLVPDSSAIVWSRFYDINNNKPLFGDRDNSVTYNFADISDERKNGYAWFGNWPEKLINKDYPKWKSKLNVKEQKLKTIEKE